MNDQIISGFIDEIEKVARLTGKDIARGAALGALTGITVGTVKGYTEKKLEKKLKKKYGKKSEVPWAAARGVTSAGAGALYALAPLIALAKMKK
jgi:hypothetical protein